MKKKVIYLLIITLLILLLTNSSLAKYTYKKLNNLYFEAHNFYFESDKLGLDNKYTNTLWDGKSVHFNLINHNQNSVTDLDIKYEVECAVLNSDLPCNLNGTGKSVINGTLSHSEMCVNEKNIDTSKYTKTECEMNGYEWKKIEANQDLYFDVNSDNAIVKVTARSIYPYKKELSASFTLIKNEIDKGSINKELNILERLGLLTITNTYEDKKCVLVEFDSNKSLVDVTDKMYDLKSSDDYVNSFKINVDGMNSENVRFYSKNLDNVFNVDDYTISVSNGCS